MMAHAPSLKPPKAGIIHYVMKEKVDTIMRGAQLPIRPNPRAVPLGCFCPLSSKIELMTPTVYDLPIYDYDL